MARRRTVMIANIPCLYKSGEESGGTLILHCPNLQVGPLLADLFSCFRKLCLACVRIQRGPRYPQGCNSFLSTPGGISDHASTTDIFGRRIGTLPWTWTYRDVSHLP